MPAGDRVVICEYFPDRLPGQYNESDLGEIATVMRLPAGTPDPTPEQLAQIEAGYARFGGFAQARVVAWYWHGIPQYSPEQLRALSGLA